MCNYNIRYRFYNLYCQLEFHRHNLQSFYLRLKFQGYLYFNISDHSKANNASRENKVVQLHNKYLGSKNYVRTANQRRLCPGLLIGMKSSSKTSWLILTFMQRVIFWFNLPFCVITACLTFQFLYSSKKEGIILLKLR